jgi:uncharacterized protein YndB with AHSA1/START domain
MTTITVQTQIKAPIEKVWKFYTIPEHITQWNNASDDWHTPHATNDLKVGGRFLWRMESKDGKMGFDFNGVYSEVKYHELIKYEIEGGRKVEIKFSSKNSETDVEITFEAETENSIELQRTGWQAILNNFKKYVEK